MCSKLSLRPPLLPPQPQTCFTWPHPPQLMVVPTCYLLKPKALDSSSIHTFFHNSYQIYQKCWFYVSIISKTWPLLITSTAIPLVWANSIFYLNRGKFPNWSPYIDPCSSQSILHPAVSFSWLILSFLFLKPLVPHFPQSKSHSPYNGLQDSLWSGSVGPFLSSCLMIFLLDDSAPTIVASWLVLERSRPRPKPGFL